MSKKPSKKEADKFREEAAAAQNKSPLHKLLYIMSVAPSGVQSFIQMHVLEIIEIELAKYQQISAGLELDPTGKDSVVKMFNDTIGSMKALGVLNKEVDATVVDAMGIIAEAIDKGVKRVMLGEPITNVGAYLDLVSCHAKMTASLAHIMGPPHITKDEDSGDAT